MGNDWFHEYFINELKAIGRKPTSNMQHEVVDSLPSSGNEQTIYFVKNDSSSSNNHYDEYVWISSSSTFEKIGSTQPDWDQNDVTAADYVKNRPFYTGDPVETVLVEERTLAFAEVGNGGLHQAIIESTIEITAGETYKVSWDGTVYECICVSIEGTYGLGNLSIMGVGSDTGEPFLVGVDKSDGNFIFTADTASSHTISITGITIPVVKINSKYLDKPDWDQNDVTASSYIKNRPFYTGYTEEKTLIAECTVGFIENSGKYLGSLRSTFSPIAGETYRVSWDGTVYESVCIEFEGLQLIGNLSIMYAGSDSGEPFLIRIGREIKIGTLDTATSHTISISGRTTQIVKINEKYLPDTVATKSDVETVQTAATNAQSTATNAQSTANTAQATAENAKIDPNQYNYFSGLCSKKGGMLGWYNVIPVLEYDDKTGKFYKSPWETEALNYNSRVTDNFIVDKYWSTDWAINIKGVCYLTVIGTVGSGSKKWSVSGVAFFDDGSIRIVKSNAIPADAGEGIFLSFTAPYSLYMPSSTEGSTKKFKITVDDSGTISATEVT